MNELNQDLKFKVSGKILDLSTYVLKTKTNTIINHTLETQDNIEELQSIELEVGDNNDINEYNNNEDELFEAFSELEAENLLTEEKKLFFEKEKIKRVLNLDNSELIERIKHNIHKINARSKLIYKKIEIKRYKNQD